MVTVLIKLNLHFAIYNTTGIAFAAKLSSGRNSNAGATLVFDSPIANVGNGYNAETGIFTAPVNGVYFFTVVCLLDFTVLS